MGININSGEEKSLIVGNGNKIKVYLHDVETIIAGKIIKDARIGFSNDLGTQFNLLGRKTIFDKFEICFNDKRKVVKFHY